MDLDLYSRFVMALVAVLALLALFAWLARRFGLVGRGIVPAARRRLAVVEVAAIDGKRRLVLVRRDQTEHLLLLGTESAVVVESGIGGAGVASGSPQAFAAMVKETEA